MTLKKKQARKKPANKARKVPMVWFICPECKDTLAWNNFNDGTPVCTKCDDDMVVDASKYRGGY